MACSTRDSSRLIAREVQVIGELLVFAKDRDRRQDNRLDIRERSIDDVVRAHPRSNRRFHEGRVVAIYKHHDRPRIVGADPAQVVERIAIRPRHVDNDHVGPQRRDSVDQAAPGRDA
jgi:hypothetical protein